MGRSPHHHNFNRLEGEDHGGILGNHRNESGKIPPSHPPYILPIDFDVAFLRREDTINNPDKRTFARTVGTDNTQEFPPSDIERYIP
ncbi:MAG TPA: hypothetical protein PKZ42_08805 [Syntrophales bacterium]|nr:hypothetical protein [Syntrophales bacterium]